MIELNDVQKNEVNAKVQLGYELYDKHDLHQGLICYFDCFGVFTIKTMYSECTDDVCEWLDGKKEYCEKFGYDYTIMTDGIID